MIRMIDIAVCFPIRVAVLLVYLTVALIPFALLFIFNGVGAINKEMKVVPEFFIWAWDPRLRRNHWDSYL